MIAGKKKIVMTFEVVRYSIYEVDIGTTIITAR